MKLREIASKYNLDKDQFESFMLIQSDIKLRGLLQDSVNEEDVHKSVEA